MEVHTEQHGKYTIVRTGCDATMCSDNGRLRDFLAELIDNNIKHICVDLTNAAVIDSSVIGAIIEFHALLTKKGGELVVLNAKNFVLEALFRTQVHRVVRFVETERQL